MTAIRKIKAGRITTVNLDQYVGEYGTIFYDEDVGELRVSDGINPGGDPVIAKKIFNANSSVMVNDPNGNVTITASDKTWTFTTNGNIISPTGSVVGSGNVVAGTDANVVSFVNTLQQSTTFDFGSVASVLVTNKLEWFLSTIEVDNGTILSPANAGYDAGTLI